MLLLFAVFAAVALIFYVYLTWNFNYWRKRNVFGPRPLPFIGNYPKSSVLMKNIIYEQQQLYEQHKGNHRYIGVFERRAPKLLILDSKLVNDVYVKHFKHFQINDSSTSFDKTLDPLFCRNVFAAQYDDWRDKRPEISSAFSSVKLRQMVPLLTHSGQQMIHFIDMQIDKTLNIKDLSTRFTADIVMNCIFSLQSDAFQVNAPLHRDLVKWFRASLAKNIVNAILSTFPFLSGIYKPPFFPYPLTEWLLQTMDAAISHRRKQMFNQQNDFLQFLCEKSYSHIDLTAMAATFFFDAFETSAMMLAQCIYHVANNEPCQKKLRAEIMEKLPFGQAPTIDDLNAMQYLDHVVNETFRISPSAFLLAKRCTQPIEFADYDGTTLLVERGTSIQLPIYAIHHDASIYEEPNSFKPERFETMPINELKKNGQFLPFGNGPRICIGQKFASYQIKIGLLQIIRNYLIYVNNKMPQPIVASALDCTDIYLDFRRLDG